MDIVLTVNAHPTAAADAGDPRRPSLNIVGRVRWEGE